MAVVRRGRAGEGNIRRRVGHDLERPFTERIARLADGNSLRSDGVERGLDAPGGFRHLLHLGGILAHDEDRNPSAAIDLGQQLAADRHADRTGGRIACFAGARGGGAFGVGARQQAWRLVGVVRRGDPEFQARRVGLPERAQIRGHGPGEAGLGPVSGGEHRHHQRDGEQDAQCERVTCGEVRVRQTQMHLSRGHGGACEVNLPEAFGRRVVHAQRGPVVDGGQRAVGEPRIGLQPARRLACAGPVQGADRAPRSVREDGGNGENDQRVKPARQVCEDVEEREDEERARDTQRRPQHGPGLFPEQGQARQCSPCPDIGGAAGFGSLRIARSVHVLPSATRHSA